MNFTTSVADRKTLLVKALDYFDTIVDDDDTYICWCIIYADTGISHASETYMCDAQDMMSETGKELINYIDILIKREPTLICAVAHHYGVYVNSIEHKERALRKFLLELMIENVYPKNIAEFCNMFESVQNSN